MAKGLIDFQTDLKSLRYGSEKPYITKKIGQAPGSQIGLEITRRVDDVSRIAQMLVDKPGLKYLLHEVMLQQIGVGDRIKKAKAAGKSTAGAVLEQIGNTLLTTVKIVGSTLIQVPVNGTGTHFLKAFRTDTYLHPAENPDKPGGPSAFAKFFGAGGLEGAPLALQGKPIGDGNMTGNVTSKLTPQPGVYSDYSPFGAGPETYFSDKQQSGIKPSGLDYDKSTYSNKLDSRKTTKNGPVKKETRINLGDQGARNDGNKQGNVYWEAGGDLVRDNINFLDVFDSVNESKPDGDTTGRDLIKFRFHVITPDSSRILYFRAFLDTFTDNYSGQWNPVKYLGRAEDFQIYGGFQRKIGLSFKIAAATREEMQPLYRKMVYLASATAPSYADSGQFMRGTIVKLTLGDYVYELPGVLNSCNFSWNTEYPWEIGLTEPENGGDSAMQELPMVLDCNIDFTPIHTFTPETGLKKYFTTGLANAAGGDSFGTSMFIDDPLLGGDPIKTAAAQEKENAEKEASNKAEKEAEDQRVAQIDADVEAAEAGIDRTNGSSATSKSGQFNISQPTSFGPQPASERTGVPFLPGF